MLKLAGARRGIKSMRRVLTSGRERGNYRSERREIIGVGDKRKSQNQYL